MVINALDVTQHEIEMVAGFVRRIYQNFSGPHELSYSDGTSLCIGCYEICLVKNSLSFSEAEIFRELQLALRRSGNQHRIRVAHQF